jgi:hypothetical protein
MQTEAIFEHIGDRIQTEIRKAKKSIFIAVAWFTNKNIFEELLIKANEGCKVFLIISNDEINRNSKIEYELLIKFDSKFYKVGDGNADLMHNKFCVIDYCTVISGSYNWSYKAENNFENIIINYNDTGLAEQFISEFNGIRKHYYPEEPIVENIFPLEKIIKRLEILKNYIALEDTEELKRETDKLKEFDFNTDLFEIIAKIEQQEFEKAIKAIQEFISQNQQLAIWNDPEVGALKLEKKNLENQLNAIDNEKMELEKLLFDFQHRHTLELGSIILQILKLRKIKFKENKDRKQEAENDYQQYNAQFETEKEKKQFILSDDEKIELKKKFRKATFLCHPDKVNDQFKTVAQKVFIDLKMAYEANDLKKVYEILNDLESGFLKSKADTFIEKDLLKVAIEKLRGQIKILVIEIQSIRESEAFKTILSISDWNSYFISTKEKLQKELKTLSEEIKTEIN